MPGSIQTHTLVYTVFIAGFLAVFFDLSRIASLGAIFYLVMDIIIHWGVLRYLRQDVGAHSGIVITAILLDAIALGASLVVKWKDDPMIIGIAFTGIGTIFAFEKFYLRKARGPDHDDSTKSSH